MARLSLSHTHTAVTQSLRSLLVFSVIRTHTHTIFSDTHTHTHTHTHTRAITKLANELFQAQQPFV